METGTTTLTAAQIHFDPKLGSWSEFAFTPRQQLHVHCDFLGEDLENRGLEASYFVNLGIKSSLFCLSCGKVDYSDVFCSIISLGFIGQTGSPSLWAFKEVTGILM